MIQFTDRNIEYEHEDQWLTCPECQHLQIGQVELAPPFGSYIHTCEKCKYLIMESEWNSADFRALSIKQPYAGLMLLGKIETRTWRTHYRGPVLIHAGSGNNSQKAILATSGSQAGRVAPLLSLKNDGIFSQKGHVIAVGRLTDCRPMTKADSFKCYVEYQTGLWCHIIEDITPVKPLPALGKLGYWVPSNDLIKNLKPRLSCSSISC